MLSLFRRHRQSKIIKILLLTIAVSFLIGFGAFGYVSRGMKRLGKGWGDSGDWVARVDGEVIDMIQVGHSERYLEDMYRRQLGEMADQLLGQIDLASLAVNQVISEHVVDILATRMGLTVSDAELADSIYRQPQFQSNGRFDRNRYLTFLRRQRVQPPEFERDMRRQILAQKLRSLVFSSVKVADSDVLEDFQNKNEKINLRFVKLLPESVAKDVEITAEQAKAYYEANKDKFKVPEKRKVSYVAFTPEEFASQVNVTDEQIKKYYDDNTKEFTAPEQVHARHILLRLPEGATEEQKKATKDKADKLRQELVNGGDFAETAKKFSEDPGSKEKSGDLGWFGKGQMVPQFEEAAFTLKPNEISSPVETRYGYHILQLLEKRDAATRTLDEVKGQIRAKLLKEGGSTLAKNAAADFIKKLAPGNELLKVAQTDGLKAGASSPFSDKEPIPGVIKGQEASKLAFELKANAVSEPFDAGNAVYVLQLTEIIEPRLPEFEEVQAKASEKVREEQEQKVLTDRANKLIVALNAGDSLDKVAAANQLEAEETGLFARGAGSVPKIGMVPDLVNAVFGMPGDKRVVPQPFKSGNGMVVCVVKERQAASPAEFAAQKDKLRDDLIERKAQLTLQAWVEQAEKTIKIERNEPLIAEIAKNKGPIPITQPGQRQPQRMPRPGKTK